MRPDAPLIKYLAQKFSPALGQEYAYLPLFLIPEEVGTLIEQEQDLLDTIGDGDDCLHLPYSDVLLNFPSGIWKFFTTAFGAEGWHDRGATWVRVRTLGAALQTPSARPLLSPHWLNAVGPPNEWLFLETWEEKTTTGGFPALPDFSLMPVDTRCKYLANCWHAFPNQWHREGRANGIWCNMAKCTLDTMDTRKFPCAMSEIIMAAPCRFAALALAYIDTQTSLRVQVTTPGHERKPRIAREKPWLAARIHYVLIDPDKIHLYGHPSGGTHTSPTAHRRRGHWRRLPEGFSKTRTRVKATFVGQREWVSQGQAYKILL